jgi:type II secretory pathway component PulM
VTRARAHPWLRRGRWVRPEFGRTHVPRRLRGVNPRTRTRVVTATLALLLIAVIIGALMR